MSPKIRNLCTCLVVVWLSAPVAAAWTRERLDYPGAARTQVKGIDQDRIVGHYAKEGGHGFIYDGSSWATLDFPGARTTTACGISGDKIVGYYSMPGWYTYEAGFLYDGRTWQSLAYPGAQQTRATGICGNVVVGYYEDSHFLYHGFMYDGVGYKGLDYPNLYLGTTLANGIWGNTIVGQYVPSWNLGQGFTYDGSTWTSVLPTGCLTSRIMGICESDMVGVAEIIDGGALRSFLLEGSTLTWIDCPWGTDRTFVSGISGDRIVGTYRDTYGGPDYSFVLTMPEPTALALLALTALSVLRRRPG